MNIRDAILAAANSIEENSKRYDFFQMSTPECGSPACALGWIALHTGQFTKNVHQWASENFVDYLEFYNRMRSLGIKPEGLWTQNHQVCASALRAYADLYHPAPDSNFARDLAARLASQPAITEDASC